MSLFITVRQVIWDDPDISCPKCGKGMEVEDEGSFGNCEEYLANVCCPYPDCDYNFLVKKSIYYGHRDMEWDWTPIAKESHE